MDIEKIKYERHSLLNEPFFGGGDGGENTSWNIDPSFLVYIRFLSYVDYCMYFICNYRTANEKESINKITSINALH